MSAATGPVLITGAGLVGSQTARVLSARGQPCTLFDTRPPAPARSDQSAAQRELGFTARHRLDDTLRHWWPQTKRDTL